MDYRDYQLEFAKLALELLAEKGYVYIAGKPRSGKTATALKVAETSGKKRWLILAPLSALEGWELFLSELPLTNSYKLTNYEQVGSKVGKTIKLKLRRGDYDGVIIDESHRLGAIGKPSSRAIVLKALCLEMIHIHLSGSATVETPCSIYHQMWISKYTPFPFKNFYDFHRVYGLPYFIKAAGRNINQYDKAKPILQEKIDEFTIYMTQEDAGITKDLQAIDKLHYVELDLATKELYNKVQNDLVIEKLVGGKDLVCDSIMKLRVSLHMIESGHIKIGKDYYGLGNIEKINYILETFGDTEDVGIMCHFIKERDLLRNYFTRATIYSSTSDAEGVDLSHLKHFIIFSSGYSGAKFVQRRERIINTNGSNTLLVHHILVKGAISEQVYNNTSKKRDYNNSTYERNIL